MRAAVIKSPGEVAVETVDDPTPASGEVVVEVAACGLCGTDLHILEGEFAPSLPVIPGHEFAGQVVARDANTLGVSEGDRVAVDPSLYCHQCHYCRIGHNNLCQRWGAIGVTVSGGAAQYVAVPAANCVRLPDHIETADATLIEPLSCAVRGYDVLRSQLGSHVLIYGAGTMGLMMLELAKRVGAVSVDLVDVNPDRLVVARQLGSSNAVTSADQLERPFGWELVVDATGNERAIQDGLGRVAPAGTFLQFGWPPTRPEPPSSPTRSTTRRSPSPARWPCYTAMRGPPNCSPRGYSTRGCSSPTGCHWRGTQKRSTRSGRGRD